MRIYDVSMPIRPEMPVYPGNPPFERRITRVHGREQPVTLGGRTVTLYPLYHPAAALYTPAMLAVLERDVARLPELLALGDDACVESTRAPQTRPGPVSAPLEIGTPSRRPVQLGLF